MTQKQALKSLEDYCKVNNMHLTSSSFTRNAYAIVALSCLPNKEAALLSCRTIFQVEI